MSTPIFNFKAINKTADEIKTAIESIDGMAGEIAKGIPTKVSELENDSNFVTQTDLNNLGIEGVIKTADLSADKQRIVFTMGDGTTKEINLNEITSLIYVDKSDKGDTVAGMGYVSNTPGKSNLEWLLKNLNCSSYGALLNYSNYDAQKCRIALNSIYAIADAVEINTPLQYSSDNPDRFPFKNTIILGNFVDVKTDGSSGTAGFAIGIAQGQNIAVVGNVSNSSQTGGLHIEDASNNVVVTGNVFDGCKLEGAALYGRTLGLRGGGWYGHPCVITGNAFKALGDKTEGTKGLYQTYTQYGGIPGANFTNNKVEGFYYGLYLPNFESINVDGCIIENCEVGVASVANAFQKGDVFCLYTPVLISLAKGATVDGIFSLTEIAEPMKAIRTSGIKDNSFATIKRFGWKIPGKAIPSNGSVTFDLFRSPKYLDGTLKILIRTNGGHYINLFGKISLNTDKTYSFTTLHKSYESTFNTIDVRFTEPTDTEFGKIYLYIDNGATSDTVTELHMMFEGTSLWVKGNDNQEANLLA